MAAAIHHSLTHFYLHNNNIAICGNVSDEMMMQKKNVEKKSFFAYKKMLTANLNENDSCQCQILGWQKLAKCDLF